MYITDATFAAESPYLNYYFLPILVTTGRPDRADVGESPCARLPSQAEGLSSRGHTAAGPAGGGPYTHRARCGTVVGHRGHPRHVQWM